MFKAEPGRGCVNIHPKEAKAFLDAHPDTQVLDVRFDAEFTCGALPGALQISSGDVEFELTCLDQLGEAFEVDAAARTVETTRIHRIWRPLSPCRARVTLSVWVGFWSVMESSLAL